MRRRNARTRTFIRYVGALLVMCAACRPTVAAADPQCAYTASLTPSFGSVTSFAAQSVAQTASATSVASCTGGLLNVLVILGQTPYLRATVSGSTNSYRLLNANGSGDSVGYSLYAAPSGQYPITPGTTFDYYQQTLLNVLGLLGGTGGNLPMYFVTTPAGNLSAGTYSDSFNIAWSWKICNIGVVACLGYATGSGTATVTLSMTVTNACQITAAPNVNLGSAPAAGSFGTVTQNVGVLCTKGLTTYTVGLGPGLNTSGGRRRMSNGGNYLQYDLFKGATNNVWGNSGGSVVTNTTTAGGVASQTFAYRAQVYSDQTTPAVGHYTDTVVVNVAW